MKNVKNIFFLLRNYKAKLGLVILYIGIYSILSVFTFLGLVPFLDILFGISDKVSEAPVRAAMSFGDYWMAKFSFEFSQLMLEHGTVKMLAYVTGYIMLIAVVRNVINYLSLLNIATLRSFVIRDLRKEMFQKLVSLPLAFFTAEKKGDIISRTTNDVSEIENSTMGALNGIIKAPLMIVITLITLFIMSWKLTLFSLIFLPLSGFLISKVGRSVKGAAKKSKERLGEVISIIEETLTGQRIIKAFNAEGQFNDKFNDKNEAFTRLLRKLYKREFLASPFSEILTLGVLCIILYVGGQLVLDSSNSLTGSFFIGYLALFSQIMQPAKNLSNAIFKISKGAASLNRIREITDAPDSLKDSANAVEFGEFNSQIEFKNVEFAYESEKVLDNINFSIKKGETVALVGPSGGGKSTLANLLARFYDTSNGEVLIDGKNLKDLKAASLRAQMGIVTQDSILFNDSVENNVTLGFSSIDQDKLAKALEISNSKEFVDNLENGTKHNVGESGGSLSGGQKQRLSIARAVYKNPDILILDEATSALDTESEKLVQDAINNLMQNRTTLVIAHRLSTIQNADKILVIRDGKIEEQGTHNELISKDGTYKSLVELQKI